MNYMCRFNDKFLGVFFVCKCMYLVGDKIYKLFIKLIIVIDFCDFFVEWDFGDSDYSSSVFFFFLISFIRLGVFFWLYI